jgi:sulfide:quinone oxidoreductase
MEPTKVTSRLSTSPQIRPEEVEGIAAAGFRSIICNRPDGEEQGQPTAEEIGAAARVAGLGFAHVPAVSGSITDQDGLAMKRAL